MNPQLIFERVYSKPEKIEPGIMRGVKIIGLESKNRRRYAKALKAGAPKYEGAKVNLDHPDPKNPTRSVKNRFGFIKDPVYREGAGVFGDLVYDKEDPFARKMEWWVANHPEGLGLSPSHAVKGKTGKDGWLDVESIEYVEAVDIVADPATNKSLFEGAEMKIIFEGVALGNFLEKKREELGLTRDQVGRAAGISGSTVGQIERAEIDIPPRRRLEGFAKILKVSLKRIMDLAGVTDEEESEVKWDELTIESLKANRSDLVEKISKAGEAVTLEEENKALKARIDEFEVAKALEEKKTAIDTLIEEAKLPVEVVTDVFRAQLESADEATMKALIEDRKTLVKEGAPSTRTKCREQGAATKGTTTESVKLTEAVKGDQKAFDAYLKG